MQDDKSMGGDQRTNVVERKPWGQLSRGNVFVFIWYVEMCFVGHMYVLFAKVQNMIQKGAAPDFVRPTVNMTQ